MQEKEGGSIDVDDEFARQAMFNFGALILGRNMFGPGRGPWPDLSWNGGGERETECRQGNASTLCSPRSPRFYRVAKYACHHISKLNLSPDETILRSRSSYPIQNSDTELVCRWTFEMYSICNAEAVGSFPIEKPKRNDTGGMETEIAYGSLC